MWSGPLRRMALATWVTSAPASSIFSTSSAVCTPPEAASVSVVSTKDWSVTDTIRFEVKGARATDITPVGITMTKDGKQAFVALGRANHVAFVEVATRKTTALALVGKRAWNVTLDKAEKQLLVVNGLSDDVTLVDVASAKSIKSLPVGRVPYGAVIVE